MGKRIRGEILTALRLYLSIIITFLCSCSSSKVEQEIDYKYLAKYIEEEYVKPSQERTTALQSQRYSNHKKSGPDSAQGVTALDKQVQVAELWSMYHKCIVLQGQSREVNDAERIYKSEKLISKIKSAYIDLTGMEFPNVEEEFRLKYGSQ